MTQDTSPRPSTLSDDEKIVHVLNRFTPGATAALVDEVRKKGLKPWLEEQLRGTNPDPEPLASRLKDFEALRLSSREIFDRYVKPIPETTPEKERRELERLRTIPPRELLAWVVLRALYGSNPVRETMCDFFRNHFAVSIEKDEVQWLGLSWERDVIRAGCLDAFGELLNATAKHPAMLVYLDNHLSRRPPTKNELDRIAGLERGQAGPKDRARKAVEIALQRGLNENYARELMELHTLGVDNGYTQADVINVARALTGWTVKRQDNAWEFEFNPEMHDMEPKRVLTIDLRGKADPSEGELVLKALSMHKGTARFIAWKFCRWFVCDDPDDALVKRIARAFQKAEGRVTAVLQALVDDRDFFDRRHFRAKFKRPWEFVVSAVRATGADVSDPSGIIAATEAMNEPLYRPADPTGFYDQAEAWRDPGALAVRWTFAQMLADGQVPGIKIPASLYADLPDGEPKKWKDRLAEKLLPVAGFEPTTSAGIDRWLDDELKRRPNPKPAHLGPRLAAVILGTPDFQKQ